MAKILKSKSGPRMFVARYGRDELAVMLIEANAKTALEIAEKLKKEIGSHNFQSQANQLSVSVSTGEAMAPAPGIQGVAHLVEAADRALYQAKRAGSNAVVVFGKEENATTSHKIVANAPTQR